MYDLHEDEMMHYGKKGMKWGVRQRDVRINRLEKVGDGAGTLGNKVMVGLYEVSAVSVIRRGGLKGASANKAANMRAVDARIEKGEASVRDMIKRFGGDAYADMGGIDRDRKVY